MTCWAELRAIRSEGAYRAADDPPEYMFVLGTVEWVLARNVYWQFVADWCYRQRRPMSHLTSVRMFGGFRDYEDLKRVKGQLVMAVEDAWDHRRDEAVAESIARHLLSHGLRLPCLTRIAEDLKASPWTKKGAKLDEHGVPLLDVRREDREVDHERALHSGQG